MRANIWLDDTSPPEGAAQSCQQISNPPVNDIMVGMFRKDGSSTGNTVPREGS